jgi:hypothetical protein
VWTAFWSSLLFSVKPHLHAWQGTGKAGRFQDR